MLKKKIMFHRGAAAIICAVSMLFVSGCSYRGQDNQPQKLSQETIKSSESEDEETILNLYFIRHGKTILNTLDRVQGWSDSPLTEAGIKAAKDTAVGLADTKFDHVYSSDRIRSIETAEIILEANTASFDVPIKKLWGLRETNFGKYEGEMNSVMWGEAMERLGVANFDELSALENSTEKSFDAIAANDETGEAENYEQSAGRLMVALDEIIKETKDAGERNVLIVGHGAAIGKIVSKINGQSTGEIPNASVTEIQYKDGVFTVKTVGDLSYSDAGAAKRAETDKEVVIYLTRHGKTIFNTMDRVQGWVDSPLTDAGIDMAKSLGKGLADTEFRAVYTSDMGRTIETAEIILAESEKNKNLTIHEVSGIRETNYGKYESGFNSDMLKPAMELYNVKDRDELMSLSNSIEKVLNVLHDTDETGIAENYAMMSSRVNQAFTKICEEAAEEGGNLLVVSHGNAIMAILNQIGTKDITEIKNASVTKIIYKNGQYTVETVNDMSYAERGAEK